ncbi:MAG: hypothetical protein KAR40_03720 [Candidatus Sabulitectum sp.]|nr:hypothetical protein [Candidatus Sabulitectum sp.]
MFKRIISLLVILLLGTVGCSLLGDVGLRAGDSAEGDLNNGVEIEELLPNSEEVLLVAGIAIEDDWPALEFPLIAGDGISLFVEADDIDPVMVVVDAEGDVVVVGDDWDEELDAFISMDVVPDGAKVIVFDISGDDGTFLLELEETDDYVWVLEIDEENEAFILENKENDQWEDILFDVDDLHRDSWETCRVFPLEVRGEKWLRIAVESDVDCVMAVLLVDGDDLEYVDYDDDTDGSNPVFSGMVESGDYIVVVDTYDGSEDAEFVIEVTEIDTDDMTVEVLDADQMDTWFSGEFREGAFVMNYWQEAGDYYGIHPEELALVFEFEIEEEGEYVFDVSCIDDTKMAIIDNQDVMIDYNDDGPEGVDPQLVLQLTPGFYSAIVVPFGESFQEFVDFRFYMETSMVREQGFTPMEDTFRMHSNTYWSLQFEAGNTYEIFAESDIDLTLTVVDNAGEEYFSDDDGGDFNPYLEIECTQENDGAWEIDLEFYSGGSVNEEVYFVARPIQRSRTAGTSAPIEIDL